MVSEDESFSETDSDPSPMIHKREYHNMLERKRRNVLKFSFAHLKNVIPAFKKKNVRASRAEVLKKAIGYIRGVESKVSANEEDIEDLTRQNDFLEEQIANIKKAKEAGDFNTIQSIIHTMKTSSLPSYEVKPETDSEPGEEDEAEDEESQASIFNSTMNSYGMDLVSDSEQSDEGNYDAEMSSTSISAHQSFSDEESDDSNHTLTGTPLSDFENEAENSILMAEH